MKPRRLISLMVLLTFLPAATGCSSSRPDRIRTEPVEGSIPLASGRSLQITGFTDTAGAYHTWDGTVRAVGEEQLEFRRSGESMLLARAQVASPDVPVSRSKRDPVLTALVTAFLVAAVIGTIRWIQDPPSFL